MSILPFNFYDLIETCPQSGCVICNLALRDVRRYLDSLLYEYVNQPETHDLFRAGRGLCNRHSWQLTEFGASFTGIAILYAGVLDELLAALGDNGSRSAPSTLARRRSRGASAQAERLEPTRSCPACETLARSADSAAHVLTEYITEPRLESAFAASHGLCRTHFQDALRCAPDVARLERLVAIQSDIWRRLKAELDTFIDKQNYLRASEAIGAEGDSWLRAIAAAAGQPGAVPPRPRKSS